MYFQELILKLMNSGPSRAVFCSSLMIMKSAQGPSIPQLFVPARLSRGKQLMLNLQAGLQTADTVRTRTGFSIITSIR